MNPGHLLIVGATGGTGQQIVRQGLEAGHDVTAFVRSPAKLPQHPRLHVVTGSLPDDEAGFAEAARDKDAVISALGRGLSFKPEGLIGASPRFYRR
jgi:putative NADH-flavin reductase